MDICQFGGGHITSHQTVLPRPSRRNTSPAVKDRWSHVHCGLSLCAHLASHGNLEPSPGRLLPQGSPSGQGPDGGSAGCPEDGEEKAEEDGEKEGQLRRCECRAWTAEKGQHAARLGEQALSMATGKWHRPGRQLSASFLSRLGRYAQL